MISRVLCTAILLIVGITTHAQEETKERSGGIFGLGVGFGYDNVRGNPGIQGQFVMSGLADITLGPRTFVNCRFGYGSYARGIYWSAQLNEEEIYWQNVSVTSAVFHRLSSLGSVGMGVGLDWIEFSRYKVSTGQAFSYDREGDVGWKRLAPSFSALANAEFVLPQRTRIVMQCYLKFSYVGQPRGAVNYFLVQTTGVTLVLMRDVID